MKQIQMVELPEKNIVMMERNECDVRKMIWSEDTEPVLTYISLSKIKEWAYTENGNFCYELCVPEPPEVTEIVDGSCIIRVKPLSEECREYSKNM